jgi:hypothetical protein
MKKIMEKTDNVKRFELINYESELLYAKKNADYGDSFDKSLDEDGLLVAKIRLGDKFNRFSQLIKNPAKVKDESIRDTLIDLSTYAKMTIMWLDAIAEADAVAEMKMKMKQHDYLTTEGPKHSDSLDAVAHILKTTGWNIPTLEVDGIPLSMTDSIKLIHDNYNLKKGIIIPGADMDGDVLRVFTDDEMKKMAEKPTTYYTSSDQDKMK